MDIGQVLLCAFFDRDQVEVVNKNAKKERGRYQAILTEKAWSMKDLLYLQKDKFFSKTGKMGPSYVAI